MRTKRSMKLRTCKECESEINKGDQYGQRSMRIGQTGMASYDGTVHSWEPYYMKVAICAVCAAGGIQQ
jgi:hypothetical protein